MPCDRRFEDAKTQYRRVLEIEPRHSQALAFLGMVYHLLNATDKAIVKYHEVSIPFVVLCHPHRRLQSRRL